MQRPVKSWSLEPLFCICFRAEYRPYTFFRCLNSCHQKNTLKAGTPVCHITIYLKIVKCQTAVNIMQFTYCLKLLASQNDNYSKCVN